MLASVDVKFTWIVHFWGGNLADKGLLFDVRQR